MSLVLDRIGYIDGPDTHIHSTTLTLSRGRLHVLLGPTLAGKTTLMRLMAGLDQPSTGRLLLDGKDITGLPVRKRSVAMVYQQFVNYPTLSVYENIASPLRVAGIAREEIRQRVAHAAKLLRLEPMLDRLPGQLSGGQQQRAAIARALVKRADLVLLDEPLGNLDYKLREELREELPRLFAESGAILVYATTDPTEAMLLGGETAALSEGRLVQFGPAASLYRTPATIVAARVFSDPPLNELPVERQGAELSTPMGRLPMPPALRNVANGRCTLAFRADAVSVDGGPPGSISFNGIVSVSEISGSESFVHVTVGDATWVCLVPGVYEGQPGDAVRVHVDMERVFLFDGHGALVQSTMTAETV